MQFRRSLSRLLLAGLFCLTVASAQEQYIEWFDDYGEAVAEAKRTGKPIFLEFRCAP